MTSTTISIRLPVTVYNEICYLADYYNQAAEERLSVNKYITLVLQAHLDSKVKVLDKRKKK